MAHGNCLVGTMNSGFNPWEPSDSVDVLSLSRHLGFPAAWKFLWYNFQWTGESNATIWRNEGLMFLTESQLKVYQTAYNRLPADVEAAHERLENDPGHIETIRGALRIIKDHEANDYLGLFL